MKKNIEKLAQLGELSIREQLLKVIDKAKYCLECSKYYDSSEHGNFFKKKWAEEIKGLPHLYDTLSKEALEEYGVEFPDLQEEYKEILPKIIGFLEEFETDN